MSDDTTEINGWKIYAHPLFLDQLEAMIEKVEQARKKDPKDYKKKRAAKLLAAVLKVAFEDIPSDPTRDTYRQGSTLGSEYKHWFRAKFLQQFRLFFRYQQSAGGNVIILAWVNDDSTLRAYESANDAYAVFRKMLKRGNPPDDWTKLSESARSPDAMRRVRSAAEPKK
ncbi:MAG: type II toxin-antitoxin system YhaV family toxin [Bradyrhizobium sp.]|uniref:type II toxin-antitoxin system YhaV family toxin n=1 Tax=unclassified Bradyrhizobium TaxID=2631580 RepID=UPI00076A1790|nr:type II toxin-antitoxin system YhaV family toxin [Bradyrhizobium sp. CCH5-F6]